MERSSYYDNLKFELIILVVLGHAVINHTGNSSYIPAFLIFIYLFHMPLFLFVSGLFHSNTNLSNRVLMLTVYILIEKYVMLYTNFYLYGTKELYFFYEKELTWYLVALLVYLQITYCIRGLNPTIVFAIVIIVGCLEGYDKTIAGNHLISRLIVFYPFYYLGSILSKDKILENIRKHREVAAIFGSGGIFLWGMLCILNRAEIWKYYEFVVPRKAFSDLPFYCNEWSRLLYYMTVAGVSACIMMIVPIRRIRWITDFGSRSLSVYLYHIPVRAFFYKHHITDFFLSLSGGVIWYAVIWLVIIIILSTRVFSIPTDIIRKLCYVKKENVTN